MSIENFIEKVNLLAKKNGLRNSKQRDCILYILHENINTHLSPEDILRLAKTKCKDASIASIYRILSFLEQTRVVNAIEIDESGKKYELNTKQHHDHFICTKCGNIIEFSDDRLEKLQEEIISNLNSQILFHELNIYGICPICK